MGARPSRGVVALITGTLDPDHPMYRAFLDATAEPVLIAGRLPKRRTFAAGAESRASVRYIGRAWNRWVTQARRYEPAWVCACPRERCTAHRGRLHERQPGCLMARRRRHLPGCSTRNLPLAELAFFKGLELQRNGRAHVHAIVRLGSLVELMQLQGALRDMAVRAGFGGARKWRDSRGRVRSGWEVEHVRSRRDVAGYVTKAAGSYYGHVAAEAAKERQQRTLPAYTRRASWSMGRRAWAPDWVDTRSEGVTWTFARAGVETVTRALEASGWLLDPAVGRVGSGGGGDGQHGRRSA